MDATENYEQYIPKISGLNGDDPTLLGILISHSHLDHFGLLGCISPKILVWMGKATRRIINSIIPFMNNKNLNIPSKGWDYESGNEFKIGNFLITPFLVDHSAYDSYAFLIESNNKRIFYTGDFRAHGRKFKLFKNMIKKPLQNIEALLLEGSSLGRISESEMFPTEREIEEQLVQVLSNTKGMVLIHTSGQNIDRIVSIFKASKRTGRKLIIDLYTAAILEATGNKNLPQSYWSDVILYIPELQRIQIKKNALFNLLNRHSKNRIFLEDLKKISSKATLLFRPLHQPDLEQGKCLINSVYIYSQWEGYWDRGDYDNVKEWLDKHSIKRINIHTSGHASPCDLKKFVKAFNPKKIIPIHTDFPEKYCELFPNTQLLNDGEWWKIF